jgi:diguanylate cyclase (GGDEF)-like protein
MISRNDSERREGARRTDTILRGKLNAMTREEAVEALYKDVTTVIYNKRAYHDLVLATDRVNKEKMILIDINNFKLVNNLYGYAVGDMILKFFAKCLENLFGDNNSFNVGGDEFVACYNGRSPTTALNHLNDFINVKTGLFNGQLNTPIFSYGFASKHTATSEAHNHLRWSKGSKEDWINVAVDNLLTELHYQ